MNATLLACDLLAHAHNQLAALTAPSDSALVCVASGDPCAYRSDATTHPQSHREGAVTFACQIDESGGLMR